MNYRARRIAHAKYTARDYAMIAVGVCLWIYIVAVLLPRAIDKQLDMVEAQSRQFQTSGE